MSIEFVDYVPTSDVKGNSGSRYTFVCDADEYAAAADNILWTYDEFNASLQCDTVSGPYLAGDGATGKVRFTATFIPSWKLDALLPDQPFQVKYAYSAMAFTIKTKSRKGDDIWVWDSGKSINNEQVMPVMIVPTVQIVLFGSRTGFNAGTYTAYHGKVNSGTFLGVAAECALFKGANAVPRALADGTMTNDAEVTVDAIWVTWNKFYNEETGAFEKIKKKTGGDPMYASVSYDPLEP